ncbi:hypothetical protein M8818_003706 [Zalaria obscura]|uniref:Uncharacterized protein n=1 Tax=Zalaria obscura TaxID=2024903 RepID=A0ACC3SEK9_9PEZI
MYQAFAPCIGMAFAFRSVVGNAVRGRANRQFALQSKQNRSSQSCECECEACEESLFAAVVLGMLGMQAISESRQLQDIEASTGVNNASAPSPFDSGCGLMARTGLGHSIAVYQIETTERVRHPSPVGVGKRGRRHSQRALERDMKLHQVRKSATAAALDA